MYAQFHWELGMPNEILFTSNGWILKGNVANTAMPVNSKTVVLKLNYEGNKCYRGPGPFPIRM